MRGTPWPWRRIRRRCVTLCLCLLLSAAQCLAVQSRFDRFTAREGLLQRTITCGLQDRHGYLWFGSEDGLLRFDGYSFREYRTDPARQDSLASNLVYALLEDRRGHLWVGTVGGGLHRFEPRTETFVRYQPDPHDPHSISHSAVISLMEDRQGMIWVGTEGGGLNRLDPASGRFTRFRQQDDPGRGVSFDSMWHLFEDRAGLIWIGTHGGGLNRFDPGSGRFTVYRHDPADPTTIASDTVGPIFEDSQGRLWVGGLAGLNRMDQATGRFRRYTHDPQVPTSLGHNHVWDIHEDSAGHLWLATFGGGLSRFDPVSGRCKRYTLDPSRLTSLSSNLVWFIFEDRSGVLWIGTDGGGLCRFVPRTEAFGHVAYDPRDPSGLVHSGVNAIAQAPDGRFWLANDGGGIQSWNPHTGSSLHYTAGDNTRSRLNSDLTESIFVDADGIVWVGTYNGGLNRFDPERVEFRHYAHDPQDPRSISDNRVWDIATDRRGRLWVATRNGLNRLLPDGSGFKRWQHRPDDDASLSDNGVWCVLEDVDGTLWVGTDRGLNRLVGDDRFERYLADHATPGSLGHDTVTALFQDRRERLWVGTNGGLCRMTQAAGRFRCYSETDGLVSNSIRAIQEDDAGHLWVSSKKGLSRFDPETEQFTNYDAADGLQGEEFSRLSLRTDGGALVFGGRNGINYFYPEAIRPNVRIPPVVLTGVRKLGRPVENAQRLFAGEVLELSHEDYKVSFEFAALDYNAPQKNRYRYRLEGLDREWVEAGARRSATYTNLKGGRYRFRVQGANNSGYWNTAGATLELVVHPAWWDTVRFQGAVVAGACLALFLQVWRMHRRQRQLRAFNRVIEARNEALSTSEARRKAIMDNTTSLITLKRLTGEYIDVNRSVCQLLGRSREEIVGRKDTAFYCSADVAQFHAHDRIVLERGGPAEFEERIHLQDTQMTVISVRFPLTDAGGEAYAICTIATDISERKRSEAEVRQIQAHLQQVFDLMPSMLVGIDAAGTITRWNAQTEDYIGRHAAEVLGQPAERVLADLPLDWAAVHQAVAQGSHYRVNKATHTTAAGTRLLDLVVYPLDRSGDHSGAMMRLDDVTERVRLEEMLVQSEKMVSVGGLAAGMAHEINNPLAGILQNLQVVRNRLGAELPKNRAVAEELGLDLSLLGRYLERRRALEMLDDVENAARRAAAIVANMLSFSRKSDPAAAKRPEDLPALLEQTLTLAASDYNLKQRYDFRKIEVERDYEVGMPPVPCEPGSLQQVFFNLMHNAAQAMAAAPEHAEAVPPRLTLRVRRAAGRARVEVVDNGPGMAPEVCRRIFEPFYTTKATGEGTGLGLAVAYFIVTEAHGGTLNVISAPGQGSRFVIELPLGA